MGQQDFSPFVEQSALAGPVEELQLKLLFQGRYVLADGRLGEKGHFRRAGKTTAFGDGDKYLKLLQVHG